MSGRQSARDIVGCPSTSSQIFIPRVWCNGKLPNTNTIPRRSSGNPVRDISERWAFLLSGSREFPVALGFLGSGTVGQLSTEAEVQAQEKDFGVSDGV
jgi:hypothetical protein